MMLLAPKLAKEQGLDNGFRMVINTGKGGGQEIFHLHIHIIGGGNIQIAASSQRVSGGSAQTPTFIQKGR